MNGTLLIFVSCVAVLTLLAAACDLRKGKIPNWLSVATLLSGLAFQASAAGWPGLRSAALGAAIGFALLLLFWLLGAGGGGDVKFMAGLGAWVGPIMILLVFITSAVLVAVAALGVGLFQLICRGRRGLRSEDPSGKTAQNIVRWRLPYAVPLSLATWGVLGWKLLPRLFH